MKTRKILMILFGIYVVGISACKSEFLGNESVNSIYYASPYLWIGTDKGIHRIKETAQVDPENAPDMIKGKKIRGIAEDKNKNIYFGVGKKVVRYNPKEDKWDEIEPLGINREDSFIQCLAIDRNNHLWIGKKNNLTAVYDGKNWTTYHIFNVNDIDFSGSGDVWLATSDMAIFSIKDGIIKEFNAENSDFPGGNIADVLVDDYDNIWLATDSGLVKYNHKLWIKYDKENSSLKNNKINSLFLEGNNSLYIGTDSGDLQVLKNNQWKGLTTDLKDTGISSIFVGSNRIIIGTNKGIVIF